MYLRGIQFSEMESIMQFIYLGEATFFEERMDEFLAVAKSLEIKELINPTRPGWFLNLFGPGVTIFCQHFQVQ